MTQACIIQGANSAGELIQMNAEGKETKTMMILLICFTLSCLFYWKHWICRTRSGFVKAVCMISYTAMTSQAHSSVLLATQEAAVINTSVWDHSELSRQKLNIKEAQQTTNNTYNNTSLILYSALKYDWKRRGGKLDSAQRKRPTARWTKVLRSASS